MLCGRLPRQKVPQIWKKRRNRKWSAKAQSRRILHRKQRKQPMQLKMLRTSARIHLMPLKRRKRHSLN